MTQAIEKTTKILEKLQSLTDYQQQEVLDFIEFLQSKTSLVELKHPDGTPMTAYEVASSYAGCVDGGPGDLATNKQYLRKMGKL